ncbi:MAG: TRAP transporter substrate-binding protein [candidate division NC10 bacterium]|nr:TRAP transporter substrate-binding protein [candidate division NC10 bacterium]
MKQTSGSSLSRRRFLSLTGLGGVGLASGWHLLAPSGAAGGANKVTAKLSHFFPTTTPFHTAAQKLAELAAQKSGGALDIQVFPAGQLGDDKAQFEQVRLGGVQMALGSSGILAQTVPAFDVFEAPYLFDDHNHFAKVIRSPIRQELSERIIKAAGVRVAALGFGGFRNVFTKKPVGSLADMKGLRIRTPEIPVYVETFKALGASPTPLPYLEVYLALQQGTIDGAENPLSSGTDQKWPEVVKFVALTRHQATGQSFQVNERWYQGLSPDLRKAIDESCLEASEYLGTLMVERDAKFETVLKQAGVTIAAMEMEPLRKAVAEVPKKFEAKWGDLYQKIRGMK